MHFLLISGRVMAASALSLLAMSAMAYQQGDMAVRFGASVLSPASGSSAISRNGVAVAGAKVKVNTDTQPELGLMYMLQDHFAAELKVSAPFRKHLNTTGFTTVGTATNPSVTNPRIGSVSVWSPEANLQWFPGDCKSVFQPYVGLGLHYAIFTREKAYGSWVRAANGPNSSVEVNNKLGWNAQVGMDLALNDMWYLNVAARYVHMNTHIRVEQQNGDVYTAPLKINPIVYTLGVAYKF